MFGIRLTFACRVALVCASAGSLSACASGFSLKKAEVDPSILTSGTGGNAAKPMTPEQLSDESTIRNAVSAADIDELNGGAVPWANSETGSRGAINSLVEEKRSDQLCRKFTTSRERFDGVSLYTGQVCMVAPGAWRMQAFDSMQPQG